MIYIIKNENKKKDKVQFVINKVVEAGGIAYAENKMNHYKLEAMNILQEFPASDIRAGMEELVGYVTDRKY